MLFCCRRRGDQERHKGNGSEEDTLSSQNILVNSVCPGWVRTDLGGPQAPVLPEEAAETPVWLATLPDDGPTGGFFREHQPIPW